MLPSWLWRQRKRPWATECWQPWKAEKGEEMDSPFKSSTGEQPGQHLELSPVGLTSDFWPTKSRRINLCCFRHQVCGTSYSSNRKLIHLPSSKKKIIQENREGEPLVPHFLWSKCVYSYNRYRVLPHIPPKTGLSLSTFSSVAAHLTAGNGGWKICLLTQIIWKIPWWKIFLM